MGGTAQKGMAEFLDAVERGARSTARGIDEALRQPDDGAVVWAVARYARALGFSVSVEEVRRERARRLEAGRPARRYAQMPNSG